ncbi:TlpA disulfide reductase family protein [Solitalea koreensis]|uniref:Thiol-disulfide isomerase or thioredoxin n=1 Tax=Solitalea koreensis TaxID=543615 RepID=A0A521CGN2_9SPHI|nr:TlpA disulfide reductase family protein [Solitalea koreensis]SMO58588.1 Thiol-disulfide isomerase or thioredoxin [Solitalea koreensis]
MKKSFLLALSVSLLLLSSCNNSESLLQEGRWRATLETKSGNEIPFNFDVKKDSVSGEPIIEIINGDERLRVDDVSVKNDSIAIIMPFFDSEFKAAFEGDQIKGLWVKHLAYKDVVMPFSAEPDQDFRFFKAGTKTSFNATGRWAVNFFSAEDSSQAVGEFVQSESKLVGTFLTTTGDYRYLEGTIAGNNLFLSCFDGSHAYLFTGKIDSNTIVNGKFYSGAGGVEQWSAVRNPAAQLPDAYSLTKLKQGLKRLDFAYPDLNKQIVSSKDERFKNKVVIVQLLGSWCPNCMDETRFMSAFYKENHTRGFEVVGLAFERTTDFDRSKKNVANIQKRFEVGYPLLITDKTSDKKQRDAALPALDRIMGFPTTIIIDKKGQVRKIHTGFSGPGTGKHYTDFVKEFTQTINELLAE